MNKGKGKVVYDEEIEESDQEFDPNEISESESLTSKSSQVSDNDSESGLESLQDENELLDLLQEAEEYGDKGDMVDGLRSGKYRQKLSNVEIQGKSVEKSQSSSAKRSAPESSESVKKNKCPRARSASSPVKAFVPPAADSFPSLVQNVETDETCRTDQDGSIQLFTTGFDKLNGLFKNALLSEFITIRNQIVAHQKQLNSQDLNDMAAKLSINQQNLTITKQELNALTQNLEKQTNIVDSSWAYFSNKRSKTDCGLFFALWKSRTLSESKEKLVSHMAKIHNHATIMRKVMNGWRGVIRSTWKANYEKKIKREAEICIQEMSEKYEDQISKLNEKLREANMRLKDSESQKDLKEAEMKRALMRGVCALNMEAMSVFRDKTIIPDPMMSTKVDHSVQQVSEPLFQAVVIPKNRNDTAQKSVKFEDNALCHQNEPKIHRVLITRHQ